MINFGSRKGISTILISTALGYGQGIFPYTLRPKYRSMIRAANVTGTTRISKSMTRYRRVGNFRKWKPWTWKYIQNLGEDGMLNAYGLTNLGIEHHAGALGRRVHDRAPLIPSFFPEFAEGNTVALMNVWGAVDILKQKMGDCFWALELNFSCPNTPDCVRDNVQNALFCVEQTKINYPDLVLIVKISVIHPPEFARQLREAGADVLHAVNTIPYSLLFSGGSPLQNVGGGGVSGGPAFEMAYEYNSRVIEYFDGPVILGCGIVDDEKLSRYKDLLEQNCSQKGWAISLCTAALRRPEWVKEVIQNFNS